MYQVGRKLGSRIGYYPSSKGGAMSCQGSSDQNDSAETGGCSMEEVAELFDNGISSRVFYHQRLCLRYLPCVIYLWRTRSFR